MEKIVKIEVVNGKPCVTSLQVAEAFGKRHDNVLRDIEQTISQLPEIFVKLNFEEYEYPFDTGIGMRMMKAYLLTKDAFTLLTMGYTGEKAMTFKVAYINRFNEMEAKLHGPALPDFNNPALAARAWAEEYERRQIAEQQRDEAIRTKAQIGSRREATSMATASAAVRQRDALADRMGEGRNWKTVRAIPWLLTIFAQSNPMYSQVGKKLTALSGRMGYAVHTVEDSRFGMVKSYHVDVIGAFKIELDKDPAMLGKYRRAA